ncbi:MAG: tail fiber protein [Pseudomonadota bacterium]
MSEPFIAEVRIWANNFAPRSWAYCDGQLLPISQNTALFSLLGTTYGGDGRTDFGLPNLQGRACMHPGRGPGLTARRLGETGGSTTVTLNINEVPNHDHEVMSASQRTDTGTSRNPIENKFAIDVEFGTEGKGYSSVPASSPPLTAMASQAVSITGGSQAHDNDQPYLALGFCIALEGIYPSRS